MIITDYEVILENVFLYKQNIFTDETSTNELKNVYSCCNAPNAIPLKELPTNLEYNILDKAVIFHDLEHAHTNTGHYFNEHFYSLVTSWLTHDKCDILLKNESVNLYIKKSLKEIVNPLYANYIWGANVFDCMDFNIVDCIQTELYKISKLILPRKDIWLERVFEHEDPLLFIKNKILTKINPPPEPVYDAVFFNKSASYRNVLNVSETLEYLKLKTKNFAFLNEFRELSFRDLICLMYNTTNLIVPWGSHLTNVLFMKSGSKVWEFYDKRRRISWFREMEKVFKNRCNIMYNPLPCDSIAISNYILQKTPDYEQNSQNVIGVVLPVNNIEF